jgi:hypothetical protein
MPRTNVRQIRVLSSVYEELASPLVSVSPSVFLIPKKNRCMEQHTIHASKNVLQHL